MKRKAVLSGAMIVAAGAVSTGEAPAAPTGLPVEPLASVLPDDAEYEIASLDPDVLWLGGIPQGAGAPIAEQRDEALERVAQTIHRRGDDTLNKGLRADTLTRPGRLNTVTKGRLRTVSDGRLRTISDGRKLTLFDGRRRTISSIGKDTINGRGIGKDTINARGVGKDTIQGRGFDTLNKLRP